MNYNKNGETIIGIIVLIIIISISFLGLYKIIELDNKFSSDFKKQQYTKIIEHNTNSIIKKLNLSNINNKEIFYINKNLDKIEVSTGIANISNKNIDYLGNKNTDISNTNSLFTRQCIYYKDIDIQKGYFCEIK